MLKKNFQKNSPKPLSNKRGFSLIEFIIVLALIGVFSFLAMPYFKPFLEYSKLKRDAWKLLSDLRWYRQLAIIDHFNYKFDFDIAADSYSIEQREAATDAYIQKMSTVVLENDITIATNTTFRPKGEAVPASTIRIRDKNATRTIGIIVFSTTGLAKMVE